MRKAHLVIFFKAGHAKNERLQKWETAIRESNISVATDDPPHLEVFEQNPAARQQNLRSLSWSNFPWICKRDSVDAYWQRYVMGNLCGVSAS